MWNRDYIVNKWPAARLVGPNVTKEQALDFIWKTDSALQHPEYACNDRQFNEELCEWLGYGKKETFENFQEKYKEWYKKLEKRGQIQLAYLESNLVASSYIYGPMGPVNPNGEVRLARNFGKWPSIEEVENDLRTIGENFLWMSFTLAIWDNAETPTESVDMDEPPTFAWKLKNGEFERVPTDTAFGEIPIPQEPDMESTILTRFSGSGHETTWPMSMIKEMWGDRV